jgi:predicted membrane metal-binding protein
MFIFISGASASVARAGIMGILTILSIILSRKSNTINNICVSAIFFVPLRAHLILIKLCSRIYIYEIML